MAEEEVVAVPAPLSDNKRKLDEVEPDVPERPVCPPEGPDGELDDDSSQAKRPKLEDGADGLVSNVADNVEARENGSSVEKAEEHHEEEPNPKEEKAENPTELKDENQQGKTSVEEVQESIQTREAEEKMGDEDHHPGDTAKPEDNQQASVEAATPQQGETEVSKEATGGESHKEVDQAQSTSRRIEVPSSKVGVLIGKGGETIRYLQFNSGARIQILRDAEADPNSASRPVQIVGTSASIEKAEKLIHAVIAEAEAGGSPALVARGVPATSTIGLPEQIEIKVSNDKVGLIIGRGGETIKNMQTRSGARIQLIPQQAEGDGSKERIVRISGDKRQIDIATDMIKDVMYQNSRSSHYSGGYNQSGYRPRGPSGSPQWVSRGPDAPPPMPYEYHHRRPYPSQSLHYNSPSYGGYPPQHMPPRSGFGAGWDQRPPHSGPYDYYGRQGSQPSGPLPSSAMGPPPSQVNYSYGQGHGPEYGHAASYSLGGLQQTNGQMYEQPKYDNHQMQPTYGGHGGGQLAGRPYGMQGPTLQGYGPPRAPQQQYAYVSTAPMQAYPSYGSVAPTDGYNHTQAPASDPAYQQQGLHAGSAPDQYGAQQVTSGYGQVPPTGGYNSYLSSQPVYGNTPAQYPGSQDPSYGGGDSSTYTAVPGGQLAYSQAAPAQPSYEQPSTQPTGYAAAAATRSGPVKSLSPQPAYPQYDANQAYAAPR